MHISVFCNLSSHSLSRSHSAMSFIIAVHVPQLFL